MSNNNRLNLNNNNNKNKHLYNKREERLTIKLMDK